MMSNQRKIKLPAGITLRGFMGGDKPTAETLRDLVFDMAKEDPDSGEFATDALAGLVKAYVALAHDEADEEDEEVKFEMVSNSDEYTAEKLWREFSIKGYRHAIKSKFPEANMSRDDSDIYECCTWYEFGDMAWPDQLLAEVAFVAGNRAGKQAIAMSDYFKAQEATP